KIRDHFLGRACPSTTFACNLNQNLTNDLIEKGVLLPEQYRKTSALPNAVADHPWGGTAAGGTLIVRGVGRDQFSIELNSLSSGACVALAPKLSGVGAPSGLDAMTINAGGVALPVSPETAGIECDAASNTILLTYGLRN
ncbi:MAG TPA: hypothetical protein DCY07_04595, partial [Rhodospirillaceae bacterium]|nr:hypothetical protein [Rhodospirillaceae bacterium]